MCIYVRGPNILSDRDGDGEGTRYGSEGCDDGVAYVASLLHMQNAVFVLGLRA